MAFFGVYNVLNYECPHGHSTNEYATSNPQVILTLHHHSAKLLSSRNSGNTITLTGYFSCFIPRNGGGEILHTVTDRRCSGDETVSCSSAASITSISTIWPQVLNIRPDNLVVDAKTVVEFEPKFSVADLDKSLVEYELVARVLFSSEHFTSEIQFGQHTYVYDDMKLRGQLVETANANLVSLSKSRVVYYVYHRTSQKSTVS